MVTMVTDWDSGTWVLLCKGFKAYNGSAMTFSGPRIVIYSYNKSQQDALFL